jgi:DUF971 family protein
MNRPWPVELRLSPAKDTLAVRFDDGADYRLEAEYLRVMTGSAEDRGHGAGPKPPVPGKQSVHINDIRPVGRYAVRLAFDDGHETGLYSWDLLHDLGANREKHWSDYLAALDKAGLAR